jgi:hypothetical protein
VEPASEADADVLVPQEGLAATVVVLWGEDVEGSDAEVLELEPPPPHPASNAVTPTATRDITRIL